MECTYITSALRPEQLPPPEWPEVALIGRSNCGKSTLINALLGRTRLARTSAVPGRTAMVNFFKVHTGKADYSVADLPGYGYSETAPADRRHWQDLIEAYLCRPNLRTVLFLVDSRRGSGAGLGDDDLMILKHLLNGGPSGSRELLFLLTKADKLNRKERDQSLAQFRKVLAKAKLDGEPWMISSLKGEGIKALKDKLFPR